MFVFCTSTTETKYFLSKVFCLLWQLMILEVNHCIIRIKLVLVVWCTGKISSHWCYFFLTKGRLFFARKLDFRNFWFSETEANCTFSREGLDKGLSWFFVSIRCLLRVEKNLVNPLMLRTTMISYWHYLSMKGILNEQKKLTCNAPDHLFKL